MMRTNPTAASHRSLVPHAAIVSVLHRERPHLRSFFEKLVNADIIVMSDLERYTASELFTIAPTNMSNRERFLGYVRRGIVVLKQEAAPAPAPRT